MVRYILKHSDKLITFNCHYCGLVLNVLELWIYLFQSALEQAVHQGTACYFKSSLTWKRRIKLSHSENSVIL